MIYNYDGYDERLATMNKRIDAAILASGENNKEEFVKRLKSGVVSSVVIYSAYDVVGDLPIDNLDEIPYKGTFIVVGYYDAFWDGMGSGQRDQRGIKGCAYESRPITDPTWLQLTVLANECILTTNDLHHVFFEGVNSDGDVLHLSFGS